jgi:hypothetical protein
MIPNRLNQDVTSLIKVNKHMGIALSELSKTLYVGCVADQRRLVAVKLKLESVIERTLKAEAIAKDTFFRRLK